MNDTQWYGHASINSELSHHLLSTVLWQFDTLLKNIDDRETARETYSKREETNVDTSNECSNRPSKENKDDKPENE